MHTYTCTMLNGKTTWQLIFVSCICVCVGVSIFYGVVGEGALSFKSKHNYFREQIAFACMEGNSVPIGLFAYWARCSLVFLVLARWEHCIFQFTVFACPFSLFERVDGSK